MIVGSYAFGLFDNQSDTSTGTVKSELVLVYMYNLCMHEYYVMWIFIYFMPSFMLLFFRPTLFSRASPMMSASRPIEG